MPSFLGSSDWMWEVFPLAAAIALATLQRAWNSHLIRRGETWPISYGRVLRATVDTQGNAPTLNVSYSYRVSNESYAGTFRRNCSESDEASTWEGALAGQQVPVRYDPTRPSRSQLLEADLQPMLQAAAPITPEEPEPIPWWKRSLFQIGLILSIFGFAASLAEFLASRFGKPVFNHGVDALLAFGAVALPLLSFWGAYGAGKRTWRAVPEWMKYLGFVVVYFAFFSALPFFHRHRDLTRERHPDNWYQIAGYFGAIEVLYAKLRSDPQSEHYLQRSLNPGAKIG